MIKLFRLLLSVIAILLGVYVLLTKNFDVMPYMLLVLGLLLLITGRVELQANRKTTWLISIIAAAFILFELNRLSTLLAAFFPICKKSKIKQLKNDTDVVIIKLTTKRHWCRYFNKGGS